MREHLALMPVKHARNVAGKYPAHLGRLGQAPAGQQVDALMDVVVFERLEGRNRLIQTGCGHAPAPDGGAD